MSSHCVQTYRGKSVSVFVAFRAHLCESIITFFGLFGAAERNCGGIIDPFSRQQQVFTTESNLSAHLELLFWLQPHRVVIKGSLIIRQ